MKTCFFESTHVLSIFILGCVVSIAVSPCLEYSLQGLALQLFLKNPPTPFFLQYLCNNDFPHPQLTPLQLYFPGIGNVHTISTQKKDKDRREGKGRRCCLGGRIDSISCLASYFSPGQFEEQDELHHDDTRNRINCVRTI